MKSAVTISLVPEARGGPFVFWDDLEASCRRAAELGFDAVEIFAPSADALNERPLRPNLDATGLGLAAVGTGAGWVLQKLTLTDPDRARRDAARAFIASIIDAAGVFGAPAIIGSMQGRWGGDVSRDAARGYLAEALADLAERAARHNVALFFEPLNRYETNMVTTIADGAALLESIKAPNVRLLADLFHMNIEEANLARAIEQAGEIIGHVHLADSNRRAAGGGHTDFAAIAGALRAIGYDGYVSAEALSLPDAQTAARMTIDAYRKFFKP